MTTYIIRITQPDVRESLLPLCTKVGRPGALSDILIVESDATSDALLDVDGVLSVEYDEESVPDLPSPGYHVQENVENWFLAGLSSHASDYLYKTTGKGVDLYILDSGIYTGHEEFDGRIETLYSFDGKDHGDNVGQYNHGTMCAGCAAGTRHGVAKDVYIYNLRYNWRNSEGIKALDTLLRHHKEKGDERPTVLSMSFSTTASWAYRSAMQQLIDNGIVCFASTGNDREAEARFPAGNDIVMGVSCLERIGSSPLHLQPADYTNYGKGTDVWAPGHWGRVAGYGYRNAYMYATGTSAACPVAAGIMAMLLEGSRKLTTRGEVEFVLQEYLERCTVDIPMVDQYSDSVTRRVSSVFQSAPLLPPVEVVDPVPPKEEEKEEEVPPVPVPPGVDEEKDDKPWYKNKKILIPLIAVVLGVVSYTLTK